LKPKNPLEVKEMIHESDEEIKVGIGSEWIVDNLHPGNNIMVSTPTNDPFWLTLVDKAVHIICESFEDANMNEWIARDVVVKGYWYERLQSSSQSYQLWDDKPLAYVFSHLILL
jgi:hypothetical protein